MALESITSKIVKADKLYNDVNKGHSADAVLRLLDPLVEERLGRLLNEFEKSPPELGALLDLRARISEVWRMRAALRDARKLGLGSQRILETMMGSSGNRT